MVLCLFSNAVAERLFLRLVRIFLLLTILLFSVCAQAQTPADSLRRDSLQAARLADSVRRQEALADSLAAVPAPIRDTIRPKLQASFSSDSFRYRPRLFFRFTDPVRYNVLERKWEGKEVVFYTVIGLLLLFAIIKNSFRRYLSDLFGSYFRTTMRQRQVKEQLQQAPLPSLLFNVFFVLSGAVFVSLVFYYFNIAADELPFWMLAAYSAIALAVIYAGKFVVLKFFGWVFRLTEATDTYIFVIFSTNKVLGVMLLPFTILLAFSYGAVHTASVTLSLILVAALFAYRFFLSYISINRMVRINLFHFLLYLAAFEILPLLLINKLLFLFLREIY